MFSSTGKGQSLGHVRVQGSTHKVSISIDMCILGGFEVPNSWESLYAGPVSPTAAFAYICRVNRGNTC